MQNEGYGIVCMERRLVIEVDGSQHAEERDHVQKRTELLSKAGFIVIRFWNNEVLNETDAVVQIIWDALNPSPPRPSP